MKRYLDKREDQSVSTDGLYKLSKIILNIIISSRGKMYTIKSWALPLAQNLHRIMQIFLWQDWREKSLVTQIFNHSHGYVI